MTIPDPCTPKVFYPVDGLNLRHPQISNRTLQVNDCKPLLSSIFLAGLLNSLPVALASLPTFLWYQSVFGTKLSRSSYMGQNGLQSAHYVGKDANATVLPPGENLL